MHLVTLSFDDGFYKSSLKTAEIYERFGLKACFNVIATGHLPDFLPPDWSHEARKADFGVWNELKGRGHEVMPHGFRHANKAAMPLGEAQDLILRCLDIFDRELKGFVRREAIFNFPYNASTPELEAWLATQVRACRTTHPDTRFGLNPLPTRATTVLVSVSHGPSNCDAAVERCVGELLKLPEGWLVFCGHGVDDESWGPISSDYLGRLLERLVAIPTVRVVPAAEALRLCGAL
jgi:peptidoglycan/xylan/chitin deacetylase (PgdA/CDA1 family)